MPSANDEEACTRLVFELNLAGMWESIPCHKLMANVGICARPYKLAKNHTGSGNLSFHSR